ncbi:hypothetical protein GEMRC1_013617 [Eukaryota sp. GEM-RC1]
MSNVLSAELDALLARTVTENVCKMYLVGLCPNDLFTNTKLMYRPCTLKHSDTLKSEYEEARRVRDYGYERDALRVLDRIIGECDKRIDRCKVRLQEEKSIVTTEGDINIEPPPSDSGLCWSNN